MTSFAFASLPAYGHLFPLMPLAEALQRAGADVSIAVGEPFLGSLPVPTVPGIEPGTSFNAAVVVTRQRFPTMREDPQTRWPAAFFGDTGARAVGPTLREQWTGARPDLVVYELLDCAAAVVAAELEVPAVSFGLGHVHPEWLGLVAAARDALAPNGPTALPWEVAAASVERGVEQVYLDPMPPGLQVGPVELLTDRISIRPEGWHDPAAEGVAVPPHRVDGPPRVYVTLGTAAYGAVDVLRQACLEVAALDTEVVVACGPDGDPALLGRLPGNVHLARYLPQAALLPTVDVVVHHGGAGTMLTSAAHGILR